MGALFLLKLAKFTAFFQPISRKIKDTITRFRKEMLTKNLLLLDNLSLLYFKGENE
jgi:hypothetical protein